MSIHELFFSVVWCFYVFLLRRQWQVWGVYSGRFTVTKHENDSLVFVGTFLLEFPAGTAIPRGQPKLRWKNS